MTANTKTSLAFYTLPLELEAEQKKFATEIIDFIRGEINPVAFKAIRVAHGVYEQRQNDTYMIRIRCAAGAITPIQLRKVAQLAHDYGSDEVHFTTRQEVQVHNVTIKDVMNVINGLREVGLSSRGGGGNTIRNILTPPTSGISKTDVFDVDPYAMALTSRLIAQSDSWNLPRKFKIAFASGDNDETITQSTCLGYIATKQNDELGFKVFVAGGMGARPMVGHLLLPFIPASRVYHVARAMKTLFDKHGNRKSKTTSRLKFLWKKLDREGFEQIFFKEYNAIKDDDSLALDLTPFQFENASYPIGLKEESPLPQYAPYFSTFKKRYVEEQLQQNLFSVKLPLRLGDLDRADAYRLCDFLEKISMNTIRCDRAQNIRLRNIPAQYLPNFFNVVMQMKKTLAELPAFIANMVNCTGASTCKLGICLPRGLSDAIRMRIAGSQLDLDALQDFRLNMSGCPNTCGMHHVAHLGFFGKVSRRGGEMYPAYNVLAGARIRAGGTVYAKKYGEVAAHAIPNFVHDFLQHYLQHKNDYSDYYKYLEEIGIKKITGLCEKYANVPALEDDASYYTDFGAKKRLSLAELGTAECSASMFDIIGVDKKTVRNGLKVLSSDAYNALEEPGKVQLLSSMLYASSRMLLVTRGLDGKTAEKVYALFCKHFITAGLVPSKFASLVSQAEAAASLVEMEGMTFLVNKAEEVGELGSYMLKLYDSMDDSLRFNMAKNTAGISVSSV